ALLLAVLLFATSWTKASDSHLWLDVPFVKQTADGCGAASLAMVMQYWARQNGRSPDSDAEAAQIQRALYSPRAHGIYASDMQNYLRNHGFQTFTFSGKWDDLQHHLEKGRPLIVSVKSSADALHYLVVTGVDDENRVLIVNDSARRKLLKYDRADFEREWSATSNWTLLAVPQSSAH
ncbi:MAG TPA: peptidase C39 family protein, partial [Terriglobales bacterium]|nr:peptidase C39 family protein [Terriglobales bacterium]